MEKLSKQCYAYPDKELYPVHTKEAALKSFEEFKKDLDNYSEAQIEMIADNFVKSAKLHEFQYTEELEAAPETTTISDEEGNSVTFSKIASIQDVQHVVDTLDASRQTLKGPFLRKVAVALFKDADALDLEGPCMIKLERFAGLGLCDPDEMVSEFCKRGNLIDMPAETSSKFYKTYRELDGMQDKEELIKVATKMCDLFSEIDSLYKLASHYGAEIKAPEDICFRYGVNDLIEEAEDYLPVKSTDTILSKKAVLENKEVVSQFLEEKYGEKPETDEELLNKVSSLSSTGIKALVQVLD